MSMRFPSFELAALSTTLAGLTFGCASRTGPQGNLPLDAPGACAELGGSPTPGGSFTFALTQPVDPSHAPIPQNDAEAILFSLLYPTLLELDCHGELRGNLASDWRASPETDEWTLELAEDTDALGVRRAWLSTRDTVDRIGAKGEQRPSWVWEGLHGKTIRAESQERTLAIAVESPEMGLPELLSLPPFAIAFRESPEPTLHDGLPGWPLGWPRGVRGFLESGHASESTLVWKTASGAGASEIRFLLAPGHDPRDLVPSRADAIFVREREVVRYFEEIADVVVTRFPWNRTYLLVTPEEVFAASLQQEIARDLAQNVVFAEARAAFDRRREYDKILKRSLASSRPIPPATPERIVYPEEDADARAIAERIAFLRTGAAGEFPTVAGADRERFAEDLRVGLDTAYIVPVGPLSSENLKRRHLLGSAPWLEDSGAVIPLVETRGALVTRAGLAGIYAAYDGVPRFDHAGWIERSDDP